MGSFAGLSVSLGFSQKIWKRDVELRSPIRHSLSGLVYAFAQCNTQMFTVSLQLCNKCVFLVVLKWGSGEPQDAGCVILN